MPIGIGKLGVLTVDVVVRNQGKIDAQLRGLQSRLQRTGERLTNLSRTLSLSVSAPVLALTGVAVRAFANFDQGLRRVNTLARNTEKELTLVGKRVREVAKEFGLPIGDILKAEYQVVSATITDLTERELVLREAAKGARAGLSSIATSTKLLISIINAYSLSTKDAADVNDVLFKTLERGILTYDELGESLQQVTAIAAITKTPIDAVGAAMATMTRAGFSARTASVGLARFLESFIKPSKTLSNVLQSVGVASGETLLKTYGLAGAVRILTDKVGGNATAMRKLFPNIRALRTALSLTRNEGKEFAKDFSIIGNKLTRSGAATKAFEEQTKSLAFALEKLKATAGDVGIALGEDLATPVRALTKGLSGLLSLITNMNAKVRRLVGAFLLFVAIFPVFLFLVGIYKRTLAVLLIPLARFLAAHAQIGAKLGFFAGSVARVTPRLSLLGKMFLYLRLGSLRSVAAFSLFTKQLFFTSSGVSRLTKAATLYNNVIAKITKTRFVGFTGMGGAATFRGAAGRFRPPPRFAVRGLTRLAPVSGALGAGAKVSPDLLKAIARTRRLLGLTSRQARLFTKSFMKMFSFLGILGRVANAFYVMWYSIKIVRNSIISMFGDGLTFSERYESGLKNLAKTNNMLSGTFLNLQNVGLTTGERIKLIWSSVSRFFSTFFEKIKASLDFAFGAIVSAIGNFSDVIIRAVKLASNIWWVTIKNTFTAIGDFLGRTIFNFSEDVSVTTQEIGRFFVVLGKQIVNIWNDTIKNMEVISDNFSIYLATIGEFLVNPVEAFTKGWGRVKAEMEKTSGGFKGFVDVFEGSWDRATKEVEDKLGKIRDRSFVSTDFEVNLPIDEWAAELDFLKELFENAKNSFSKETEEIADKLSLSFRRSELVKNLQKQFDDAKILTRLFSEGFADLLWKKRTAKIKSGSRVLFDSFEMQEKRKMDLLEENQWKESALFSQGVEQKKKFLKMEKEARIRAAGANNERVSLLEREYAQKELAVDEEARIRRLALVEKFDQQKLTLEEAFNKKKKAIAEKGAKATETVIGRIIEKTNFLSRKLIDSKIPEEEKQKVEELMNGLLAKIQSFNEAVRQNQGPEAASIFKDMLKEYRKVEVVNKKITDELENQTEEIKRQFEWMSDLGQINKIYQGLAVTSLRRGSASSTVTDIGKIGQSMVMGGEQDFDEDIAKNTASSATSLNEIAKNTRSGVVA